MLKESIKDLINAIAEGDTLAIDNSFNDIMAHKISDRLDDMRMSVAQNMFGAPVVEESYELNEEEEPTGLKIYHTDKSGKAGHHIVFSHQDANRLHKQVKKEGGKITHHALMYGTKEGEKKSVNESVELAEQEEPTGLKIYHTDKSGKAGHHIVFTHQDAARLHKQIKKEGGKVTHHALMYGTKEGEKKSVNESFDMDCVDSLQEACTNCDTPQSESSKKSKQPENSKKSKWREAYLAARAAGSNHTSAQARANGAVYNEELQLEDFTVEEIEEFMMSEDYEQLDELSKSTLSSYIKKAAGGVKGAASLAMQAAHYPDQGHFGKAVKRVKGIEKAADKLAKEDCKK